MATMRLSDVEDEFNAARERVNEVWNYLYRIGVKKKDVAEKISITPSNFTQAIKGNPVNLTFSFLQRLAEAYPNIFSSDWIITGRGKMLKDESDSTQIVSPVVNQAWANNSPNAVVNAAYNGNVNAVKENPMKPNKYGDSLVIERNWKPVIPSSLSKLPNFDIMEHLKKHVGTTFEYLYSGTATLDMWYYLDDNDLYPFYQKGDCLGLQAYHVGDLRIKTGDVYAIDTVRDGLIVRRCRLSPKGDIITYTFNDSDPQEFLIPRTDVIRIYKKVLMFRY